LRRSYETGATKTAALAEPRRNRDLRRSYETGAAKTAALA